MRLDEISKMVGIEPMMNLREVAKILGMSTSRVIELVKQGKLQAYNTGEFSEITSNTAGLRFEPSAVRAYLDSVRVGNHD